MAKQNWRQLLKGDCPVFYFYSMQEHLVRHQARQLLAELEKSDPEITQLDGPAPSIEEIIACAGTISFFGTRRVVYIPGISPAAYSDKDLKELCQVLEEAENATFVLTSVFADKKAANGKRVKTLTEHCAKIGYAQELLLPSKGELSRMLQSQAAELGARMDSQVAMLLIERCGEDMILLGNEVEKLAAVADYKTITAQMVEESATQNLEANVFAMADLIGARNTKKACELLHKLLFLRQEPIAITAALAGTYEDYYRLLSAKAAGKGEPQVKSDFHYGGLGFRIGSSQRSLRRLNRSQTRESLAILQELDEGLKRSPVDAEIQMETAICRLVNVVSNGTR